jgi:hypothetical protein
MKSRQHHGQYDADGSNALEGLARVFQSFHQVIHDLAKWFHRSSQTRVVGPCVQLAAGLASPSLQPFFFVVVNSALHSIASVFVVSRKETNIGGLIECLKKPFAKIAKARPT